MNINEASASADNVEKGNTNDLKLDMQERPTTSQSQNDATAKKLGFLTIYLRILAFASPAEKCMYFLGVIAAIGSGTILPLMTAVFGNFVSVFTEFGLNEISPKEFRGKVSHYTLYFVYLFIAKACATYAYMVLFTIVAANVNAALRKRYLHVVLGQRIAYHETKLSTGQVSLALSTHSNAIRSGLAEKFGGTVKAISTVVAAFVVALHAQWKLALVTATIIPAAAFAIGITSIWDEKHEESSNIVVAEGATVAEEIMSSMRTVRALGAEKKLADRYHTFLKAALDIGLKRAPWKGAQAGLYFFFLYSGYALAFWYGIRLFARHEAQNSGTVITTLFSIIIGINAFSELASSMGAFMHIRTAGIEMFKILDRSLPKEGSLKMISPDSVFREDIALENVTFSYPTRPDVKIMNRFSLTMPAGKTTALVGPSGSGKSTVVNLLLRWYDANEGQVYIGGQNLIDIPFNVLRSHIGFVQQEPALFSGTIYENVENGLAGTKLSDLTADKKRELVIKACKLANAHDFVSQLPGAYDTPIGNRGTMLSGGQKQRLAIARAIVKDPPILILDEATSALDATSEAVIQQALENVRHNRTTISIAHRLSTIKNAEQIVVIRKGDIAEIGTHDSLLSLEDSLYSRLWEAQTIARSSFPDGEENEFDLSLIPLVTKQETQGQDCKLNVKQELKTKRRSFGSLLLSILGSQKKSWWVIVLVVISSVIAGALFPMQAYLYSKIVNTFQLRGSALSLRGNFWALMWFITAMVVGIGYLGIGWGGSVIGQRVAEKYRFDYFHSMISQPMGYFDLTTNSPSNLLSRLSEDPDAVNALAADNIVILITVGIAMTSTVALSLSVGWKLGLVVLFGGLPIIFGAGLIRERMENSFEEKAGALFTDSVGYAGECIQAIRTVSALNMEPVVEGKFSQLLVDYCQQGTRYAVKSMVVFALADSVDLLSMALAFWYGGRLLSTHEYTTTQFFIVYVSIVFGSQSLGNFFAHSSDISKGASSTRAICNLRASIPPSPESAVELPDISQLDPETPVIEFRNVVFAYPTRPSRRVLKGINMKIYPGQSIALVGASGSGKSTMIQLLEAFYPITSGELLIAGNPIQRYTRAQISTLLALVGQEPVLFQGSIRENIDLGTRQTLTTEETYALIQKAQLEDLVSSLPSGLETTVGTHGSSLSGGQKQRVAIARALAANAPILLLDEATSALDSTSERLIQEAIKEGSKGKTVVAVAHRLSTIQDSNVIFVFHSGRIVESGSHQELLGKRGFYWAMVRAQNGLE